MGKQKVDIEIIQPCIDPEEDSSTKARRRVIRDFFKKIPVATKNDAVRFLVKHYPEVSKGGHRGFLQREFPDGKPWEDSVKDCPKCEEVHAEGNEEIQELFGTRKSTGKIIAQSWCRKCR